MYKITELQIYEAKADNKRETDKCSIQRTSTKKKKKFRKDMLNLLTNLN